MSSCCQHHALWVRQRAATPACEALLCEDSLAPPHYYGWLQAPAWPRCRGAHLSHKRPSPLPHHRTDEQHTERPARLSALGSRMERALTAVCSALIGAAPELDALDAK